MIKLTFNILAYLIITIGMPIFLFFAWSDTSNETYNTFTRSLITIWSIAMFIYTPYKYFIKDSTA